MPIYIETMLPGRDIPRSALIRSVRRVLRGESRDHAAVTVVMVDDAYIRRLNHTYRHLDRATDVLSFRMDDSEAPAHNVLGEIYISLDRARAQAVRYHVSLDDELRRLAVHGCLHLLGYDHHLAVDRDVMRRKEALYLNGAEAGPGSEG
jgi:probable rRNA maturation factor